MGNLLYKIFQIILKLRPSPPNYMIYGEVGKLPLQISVDKQLIAYWLRVLNTYVHTSAYMVYMIALKLFHRYEYKSQLLKRVQYILDSCGLSYIIIIIINYMWYQQQKRSTKQCMVIIYIHIYIFIRTYFLQSSTQKMQLYTNKIY